MNSSQICYNTFENALQNHKTQLTRQTVLDIAKQSIDAFFLSNASIGGPVPVVHPAIGGKSDKITEVPMQWSRLMNHKTLGLKHYFTERAKQLQDEHKGLSHFNLTKMLRDEFEPQTEQWTGYVNFVRENHPNGANLQVPSPRKDKTPVSTATATPALAGLPQTGVTVAPLPTAAPVAVPLPQTAPTTVPAVPCTSATCGEN